MRAALTATPAAAAVEFTRESWRTVWPDAKRLAELHSAELGLPPLQLDERLLEAACDAGALHIFGARAGGELQGYICWNVGRHLERKGQIMAEQGPWFCAPGASCGKELFRFSLGELAGLGVSVVYPHHFFNSRGGQQLEGFFVSLGARAQGTWYELELGGPR